MPLMKEIVGQVYKDAQKQHRQGHAARQLQGRKRIEDALEIKRIDALAGTESKVEVKLELPQAYADNESSIHY